MLSETTLLRCYLVPYMLSSDRVSDQTTAINVMVRLSPSPLWSDIIPLFQYHF